MINYFLCFIQVPLQLSNVRHVFMLGRYYGLLLAMQISLIYHSLSHLDTEMCKSSQ